MAMPCEAAAAAAAKFEALAFYLTARISFFIFLLMHELNNHRRVLR